MKKVVIGVLALVVLSACSSSREYAKEDLDAFAQCLTEKGVTMYGAYWCPHCAATKKRFGSSFQYVKYVECDPKCKPDENGKIMGACQGYEGQPELCLEKNIQGYDTWENSEGQRAVGEPSFEDLAELSGCPAPVQK